jgi:hypothetical protein
MTSSCPCLHEPHCECDLRAQLNANCLHRDALLIELNRRSRRLQTHWHILVGILAAVVVVIIALLICAPIFAEATTMWDVTYLTRGAPGTGGFYGDGAYEFLWTPDYTTVYLHDGNWIFQGMYATPALGYPVAILPDGFPLIAFPSGSDAAVAVPIIQPESGPVVTPEPSTWLLLLSAGMALALMRARPAHATRAR